MKKLVCLLTATLLLSGCAHLTPYADLPVTSFGEDDPQLVIDDDAITNEKTQTLTAFSLDILKATATGENTLTSPLSLLSALAMTINGAQGETLAQMEGALGMEAHDLNQYLYMYMEQLPTKGDNEIQLSNSIWERNSDDFTMSRTFALTNQTYLHSKYYRQPFDESTRNEINWWVADKTDGKIDTLLTEEIPDDVMVYLINALSFDAVWDSPYTESAVSEGVFTTADGTEQTCELMSQSGNYYIALEGAQGFYKPYANDEFAFVAILPDGDLDTYLETLDVDTVQQAMDATNLQYALTYLPKFAMESNAELSDVLSSLGMSDAFDLKRANFSGMGTFTKNANFGQVLQKTMISVDEEGTKAGAVTAISMSTGTALPDTIIRLDHPFFFMIVDTAVQLPLFMGVVDVPATL